MSGDSDDMFEKLEAALGGSADRGFKLVGVAEAAAWSRKPERAVELARRAIAAAPGDPATRMRVRRLLGSLLPRYHVPMMNDERRNRAWDEALRARIEPGMLALEIGTGAGMLAMMAARAGAQVVTCEIDAAAVVVARELAARNGLGEHIRVVGKSSRELEVGIDLERPADLLICDIFGDGLLNFDPLPLIQDARDRLLRPGAPSVPKAIALKVALAHWEDYERVGSIGSACGFDLEGFADFVPAAFGRPVDTPGLNLLSEPGEAFRFDLAERWAPPPERLEAELRIVESGTANIVARWIRLELDELRALEARPEPGAKFFSGLTLAPLDREQAVELGDKVTIGAFRQARTIDTWLEPKRAQPQTVSRPG